MEAPFNMKTTTYSIFIYKLLFIVLLFSTGLSKGKLMYSFFIVFEYEQLKIFYLNHNLAGITLDTF